MAVRALCRAWSSPLCQSASITRLERRLASLEKDFFNSSKPLPSDSPPFSNLKPPKTKRCKGSNRRCRVLLFRDHFRDRLAPDPAHKDLQIRPDDRKCKSCEDGQHLCHLLHWVGEAAGHPSKKPEARARSIRLSIAELRAAWHRGSESTARRLPNAVPGGAARSLRRSASACPTRLP